MMKKCDCAMGSHMKHQSWGSEGQMPKNIYCLYLSIYLIRQLCCLSPSLVLKIIYKRCSLYLCALSAFLDLEVFLQMSQVWVTPVIWFASMWALILPISPSFPQTLHIITARFCFPIIAVFPLFSIIDLIWSSNWLRSTLTNWLLVVDSPLDTDISEEFSNLSWLTICLFGCFWWKVGRGLNFSVAFTLGVSWLVLPSAEPVRPFSLRSSATARKESRFSWKTFASPL